MINLYDKCPFCNNINIIPIWKTINFDYCKNCDLYFRNPMPTEKELNKIYKDSWSEYKTSEIGSTNEKLAKIYAFNLLHSLGKKDFSNLKILDFGAGQGAMLNILKKLGADAYAFEPFGFTYLKSKGYEKIYKRIEEIKVLFDGIIMIDVLEHLNTPWETLLVLQKKLVKEGWIYISTCNPKGLNALITKENWREACKKGHLVFTSANTLEKMLLYAGFKKIQRLKWYIRFHYFPWYFVDYILQFFKLDGELRYLAWQ